ncbi:MAG: hypothetical protein H5T44_01430 [Thermoplasmatales archaeon]|nr:hypothetical protein [Thermoplasmatales archaeon]
MLENNRQTIAGIIFITSILAYLLFWRFRVGIVAMLRDVGFFSWIGIRLNKFAKFKAKNLFVIILFISTLIISIIQ